MESMLNEHGTQFKINFVDKGREKLKKNFN